MAARDEKLRCPCCKQLRAVSATRLLQAEEAWRATGAMDVRRLPGWSVEAARTNSCLWACIPCFEAGRAIEGHPALQQWCDHNPYFAFIDVELPCNRCGNVFLFSAKEQQHWYETLQFWVQSRPKQCLPCRRALRRQ